MKFSATLISTVAAVTALVSGVTAASSDNTNAGRIARGLPPLKPRNLFDDKRHRALAPRQSASPNTGNDLTQAQAIPGGACGCGYLVYTAENQDGTYFPYVDGSAPFDTITDATLLQCQQACDSNSICQSGLWVDGNCSLYDVFGGDDAVPAPEGLAYFEYNSNVQDCLTIENPLCL